jgi:hypothetical protein
MGMNEVRDFEVGIVRIGQEVSKVGGRKISNGWQARGRAKRESAGRKIHHSAGRT